MFLFGEQHKSVVYSFGIDKFGENEGYKYCHTFEGTQIKLMLKSHFLIFLCLQFGRSKWNGHVGKSGVVISLETPLNSITNPALSVQLNGGFEF
jgi:hypothetical protein